MKVRVLLHSFLSERVFLRCSISSLVIFVPRIVSQCTKNGCAKFDLIPITFRKTFNTLMVTRQTSDTYLMMNIMIIRIIRRKYLERIKGQTIPTMIIHSLTSRHNKEQHSLSRRQPSCRFRYSRTQSIQQKSLHRVIIQ